ncbi:hypothetical protein QFZ63_001560 [Streptomyces sp. B3I7]|uniref:hypothetical protein n=1 Tax=Streptomyces sp. B3I7 TaxID=3042269 RepID=UPI002787667F|nr:hypothetical protein [Streptomyces sp. B3I7]MDQ0809846.1 hypothetical protein [Streptomyces sp. B3I7]
MLEPRTPLSEEVAASEAQRLIAAAYRPTSYRDTTPVPTVGSAPPVAQPGRPPMSAKAVDDSARMLTASVLVATSGGAATAILWASGHANPAVVGLVFGAPTALVLALGRLAKRVRPEPDVHHHYEGPVYQDQRNVHSSTRGVWAKNTNQQ